MRSTLNRLAHVTISGRIFFAECRLLRVVTEGSWLSGRGQVCLSVVYGGDALWGGVESTEADTTRACEVGRAKFALKGRPFGVELVLTLRWSVAGSHWPLNNTRLGKVFPYGAKPIPIATDNRCTRVRVICLV